MSNRPGPIAPENLPTVVAVAAILGLLSLAYGVYLNRQIHVVAVGAAALDVKAARRDVELESRIKALTTRLDTLEAARAATPPAAVAGASEGAAAVAVPDAAAK